VRTYDVCVRTWPHVVGGDELEHDAICGPGAVQADEQLAVAACQFRAVAWLVMGRAAPAQNGAHLWGSRSQVGACLQKGGRGA